MKAFTSCAFEALTAGRYAETIAACRGVEDDVFGQLFFFQHLIERQDKFVLHACSFSLEDRYPVKRLLLLIIRKKSGGFPLLIAPVLTAHQP